MPVAWKLVKLPRPKRSLAQRWLLHSPYWSGGISLTTTELLSARRFHRAVLLQTHRNLPVGFWSQWTGGLLQNLLDNSYSA